MSIRLGDIAPDFEQASSAGRNFHEMLRVIDSLQLTDNHKVATPANGQDGQDGEDVVIVPSLKDEAESSSLTVGYSFALRPRLGCSALPRSLVSAGACGNKLRARISAAVALLTSPASNAC